MTRTKGVNGLRISFGNFTKTEFFSKDEVLPELAEFDAGSYNSDNAQLTQAKNRNIAYNINI